jgi:putative glutamine amidotransferase
MQTDLGIKSKTIQYLDQSLSQWISGLGGLPLMIPSVTKDDPVFNPQDYARNLDALVLQGGNDISPSLYGEDRSEKTWRTDLARDEYELKLIQAFLNEGKPILGICRGMQLINTFFGGSLYQDLESSLNLKHYSSELYERFTHKIEFQAGGFLDSIYGSLGGQNLVNSIHHQAIKKIGRDLSVEAFAEDKTIEAIRWNGNSFILGVQWHPEFHVNGDGLLPAEPLLGLLLEQARLRKYYGSRDRILQPQNVLSFSKSSKFTLGTELELQLIHPETFDLYPMSVPLLDTLKEKTQKVKSEIFQSMIEIETAIQPTAQKIEEDLN